MTLDLRRERNNENFINIIRDLDWGTCYSITNTEKYDTIILFKNFHVEIIFKCLHKIFIFPEEHINLLVKI